MTAITLAKSLIDRFENDTDAEIVALQAALPLMVFDVDWSNQTRPYCVVEDKLLGIAYQPIGKACRIDSVIITFSVYSDTRLECNTIMTLIEAAYIDKLLSDVTDGSVMATPTVNDRFIRREELWYHGQLSLLYHVEYN